MHRILKNTIAGIACMLLTAGLLFPGDILAQPMETKKSLLATGTGKIRHNDSAAAREAAINEGLINAIGLVISDLLPREIIIQNFPTLNDLMYNQTGQFVLGYRVLAETRRKDLYRVILEADIAGDIIKDQLTDIGINVEKGVMPKVLILMSQQNIDDAVPRFWWGPGMLTEDLAVENAMIEAMGKKGFSVAERGALPTPLAERFAEMSEPDTEAAILAGKYFNVDIVIVGSAYVEPASNTMGDAVRSFKATVSARAVNVESAEEIGATYQTEVGVSTEAHIGGENAILRAGMQAGDDIARQIIIARKKHAKEDKTITLVVTGNQFLAHFIKFRKALDDIPNVGEIQTREMKIDEAILEIVYPDAPRQLANALMLKSFNGFGINISEIKEDTVKVELIAVRKAPQKIEEETLAQ